MVRLWTAATAPSRGGCGAAAVRAEERHGGTSYGVVAAARLRAVWLRGHGGGTAMGGATTGGAAAAAWEDSGGTEER
jgi:hypothetical protein